MSNTAGVGSTPGTPLTVQTEPTPVPIGNGVTLVNQGTVTVTLSSSENMTDANSWTLAPNGASHPVPASTGPLWAVAPVQTTILVIPQVLNVFNPNVLSSNSCTSIEEGQAQNLHGQPVTVSDIPIPPGISTLILCIVGLNEQALTGGIPQLSLSDGSNLLNPAIRLSPYLRSGGAYPALAANYTWVLPYTSLTGLVDFTLFNVTPVGTVINWVLFGDTATYAEKKFYNGQIQAVNGSLGAAGSLTLLTGPARILAVQVSALTGTGGVFIATSPGGGLIRLDASTDEPANQGLPLPDNTILPLGGIIELIQSTSGASAGQVTYAYP